MAGVSDDSREQPQLVVMPAGTSPMAMEVQAGDGTGEEAGQTIEQPGKVMRIGTMIRQLLEEVRQAPLDEASRIRLREVYDTSLRELQEGLSPDLSAELTRMAPPLPSRGRPQRF